MAGIESLDAVALKNVVAQVAEPNVTFERDELQRKLDRREIDIARKDKELHAGRMEVFRLQKESKLGTAEIQNLRDRNETLQQSLMNARLLSQNARDEATDTFNQNRIRELEAALSAAIHKIKKVEAELERWQEKWQDTDKAYTSTLSEIHELKTMKNTEKEALELSEAKYKAAQSLNGKLEDQVEEMRQQVARADQNAKDMADKIDDKQNELDETNRSLAEARGDNAKLKSVLSVRSETNSVLRAQLEEISGNTFVITKDEMNRYKKMELDHKGQVSKIAQINKALEHHMDLVQRSEERINEVKEKNTKLEHKLSDVNVELFETRKRIGSTGDREKILKREVVKLRKESQELRDQLAEMEEDPHAHDEQIKELRQALSGTSRSRQEELELKERESKKRKMAEESLAALRNRISFLLEQLEYASQASTKWQEQKAILKSEVETLHNINTSLRKRLSSVQSYYLSRNIPSLVDSTESFEEFKNGDSKGGSHLNDTNSAHPHRHVNHHSKNSPHRPVHRHSTEHSAGDILSGKSSEHISTIGGAFEHPAADAMPNTVESHIERVLFDTVCAFSSGKRKIKDLRGNGNDINDVTAILKSKAHTHKTIFKVQALQDGPNKFEIITVPFHKGEEDKEAAAAELLIGTKINSFLNFCQSRSAEKSIPLYTEKFSNLLDYMYNQIQDTVDQYSLSKMELAQQSSKVEVGQQRIERLRVKYSLERTAKQKNVMKYMREQMRLSDIRVLLDVSNTRCKNELASLAESGADLLDTNKGVVTILNQVKDMSNELALVGASSGTTTGGVGALEIRLPDSEIDDETCHSVIGLLSGASEIQDGKDTQLAPLMLDGDEKTAENMDSDEANGDGILRTPSLRATLGQLKASYLERVLMLNLKGNLLSDISCRNIAIVVESSPRLRMVDLRENGITERGAKILFDSTRKNKSILYVTQRQNGFMIEGHREISSQGTERNKESKDNRSDFNALVNNVNFPLRIDIRFQDAKVRQVEDTMFEQLDFSAYMNTRAGSSIMNSFGVDTHADKSKGGVGKGRSTPSKSTTKSASSPTAYRNSSPMARRSPSRSNSPTAQYGNTSPMHTPSKADMDRDDKYDEDTFGQAAFSAKAKVTWNPEGIVGNVKEELKGTRRPISALARLNDESKSNNNSSSIPPRPQSAFNKHGNRNPELQVQVAMGNSYNDPAVALRDSYEFMDGNRPISVTNSPQKKSSASNDDLIDMIEGMEPDLANEGFMRDNERVGSLLDQNLRNGHTVGALVDSKMRTMQSVGDADIMRSATVSKIPASPYNKGADLFRGSGNKKGRTSKDEDGSTPKQKSVKLRILQNTKKIYNNKNAFKDMPVGETDDDRRRKNVKETKPLHPIIPKAMERGGGMTSVAAARTVREKMNAVREEKLEYDAKVRRMKEKERASGGKRPSSAPARKKRGAHKLLRDLERLNPTNF